MNKHVVTLAATAVLSLSLPAQAQVSKACEDAFEGYQAVEPSSPLASSRRVELLRACVAACGRVPPIAKKCGADLSAAGKVVTVHVAAQEAVGKAPIRAFSVGFGGDVILRVTYTEPARPLYLRPGSYPVHLASEGMVAHDDVLVVPEDAEELTLTFDFGAAAKAPPPPERVAPVVPAPAPVEVTAPPTVLWGAGQYLGLGTMLAGAASAAVGAVFGGLAMDRKSAAGCPDNVCGPQGDRDALRGAARFATVSTVAFVVGGALVAGGLLTFVLAPRRRVAPPVEGRLIPVLSPGFGGASVVWTY